MIQKIPTAGIILAAGASTRFGRPKQLVQLNDRCLIEWVLDAALKSKLNKIILVLGCAHREILQALGHKLQHSNLSVEINLEFKKGQSYSLRTGLSKVKNDFASVMFLLADQPMLNAATVNALLENYWETDKDICVPTYRGKRKNPTIFSHRFYNQLMQIRGDIGARQLIEENPHNVLSVEIDNSLCFWDIDTPQDAEKLKKKLKEVECNLPLQ